MDKQCKEKTLQKRCEMIYLMCSFERAIFQKSLSLNCESDWPGGSAG